MTLSRPRRVITTPSSAMSPLPLFFSRMSSVTALLMMVVPWPTVVYPKLLPNSFSPGVMMSGIWLFGRGNPSCQRHQKPCHNCSHRRGGLVGSSPSTGSGRRKPNRVVHAIRSNHNKHQVQHFFSNTRGNVLEDIANKNGCGYTALEGVAITLRGRFSVNVVLLRSKNPHIVLMNRGGTLCFLLLTDTTACFITSTTLYHE